MENKNEFEIISGEISNQLSHEFFSKLNYITLNITNPLLAHKLIGEINSIIRRTSESIPFNIARNINNG